MTATWNYDGNEVIRMQVLVKLQLMSLLTHHSSFHVFPRDHLTTRLVSYKRIILETPLKWSLELTLPNSWLRARHNFVTRSIFHVPSVNQSNKNKGLGWCDENTESVRCEHSGHQGLKNYHHARGRCFGFTKKEVVVQWDRGKVKSWWNFGWN